MGSKYKEEYKPGANEYSWPYIYSRHTSTKGEPLSLIFLFHLEVILLFADFVSST